MNLPDFVKTLYLGDRGCKSIVIDGWNDELKIQADCISRVRGSSWNYYTAEDIENGYIVFTGVESVAFDPPGVVPNAYFGDIQVEPLPGERYLVKIYVDSVTSTSEHQGVEIHVVAKSVALEDPRSPNVRIVH